MDSVVAVKLYSEGLVSVYRHKLRGRCVVASRNIPKGTLISVCSVEVVGFEDIRQKCPFDDYPIYWTDTSDCIAFGIPNLVNHAEDNNAEFTRDYEKQLLSLVAIKDIPRGHEVTIQYACDLWFTPTESIIVEE